MKRGASILVCAFAVVALGVAGPASAYVTTYSEVAASGDHHSCGLKTDASIVCWPGGVAATDDVPALSFDHTTTADL